MRFGHHLLLLLCLGTSSYAQRQNRLDLGRLQTGATVSFTRSSQAGWGLEIAGGPAPRMSQPEPAQIKVSPTEEDVRQLAAAYKTIRKSSGGIDAEAEIPYGDSVVFRVHDHWALSGAVLSVRRMVEVDGTASGGFESAVLFVLGDSVPWSAVNYMAPGALYGDPTYNGERSPGGTLNYAARRYQMREDLLPSG